VRILLCVPFYISYCCLALVFRLCQWFLNLHRVQLLRIRKRVQKLRRQSIDINTGWQYTVTGTNVKHSGSSVSPTTITAPSQTTDGITYTWVGLDHSNKPNWQIHTDGSAFQFTETYAAPGVSQQTIIQRITDQTSITDTTSIFQQ